MSSKKRGEKNEGAKAKKTSLPAFGFAADLLKGRKPKAEATKEEDLSTPAAAEVPPPRIETSPTDDSDRVFAFADSLEADVVQEQAKKIRLETWVTLSLAGETYALPVEPVREILRISAITRVPHAPHPIRGVTNLRGRVIPVIDLRIRLQLPEEEMGRGSRIIVVSSRGRLLGLLVDSVHQVVHLDLDHIQPPPEDVMTVQSDYISGVYHVEEGLILLLDVDRVLVIRDSPLPPAVLHGDADSTPHASGAVG